MAASGIMVLSACMILRENILRRSECRPSISQIASFLFSWRLVAVTMLIALFALAIPKIGFIAAASLFQFATMSLLWRGRLLMSVLITAGSIAVIYTLFRLVFQVVLPRGTIWL